MLGAREVSKELARLSGNGCFEGASIGEATCDVLIDIAIRFSRSTPAFMSAAFVLRQRVRSLRSWLPAASSFTATGNNGVCTEVDAGAAGEGACGRLALLG